MAQIPAGTKVRVRTTNGGDATGTLTLPYMEPFDAVLDTESWVDPTIVVPMRVEGWRVRSVERVA